MNLGSLEVPFTVLLDGRMQRAGPERYVVRTEDYSVRESALPGGCVRMEAQRQEIFGKS
jgi:hypothetical protein